MIIIDEKFLQSTIKLWSEESDGDIIYDVGFPRRAVRKCFQGTGYLFGPLESEPLNKMNLICYTMQA